MNAITMIAIMGLSTMSFLITYMATPTEEKAKKEEKEEETKTKRKNFEYLRGVELHNKKLEKKLEQWDEELQRVDEVFQVMRKDKQERILAIVKDNDEILVKYIDSNLYTKEKLDRTFTQKLQKDIEKMEQMREETKKEIMEEFEKKIQEFGMYNRISRIDRRKFKEEKRVWLIEDKNVPEKYRKRVAIMNMKNKEIWKERNKRDRDLIMNLQYKIQLMNEVIQLYLNLQEEERKENECRLDTMYLNIDDLMKIIVRNDLDEELLKRKIDRGNER